MLPCTWFHGLSFRHILIILHKTALFFFRNEKVSIIHAKWFKYCFFEIITVFFACYNFDYGTENIGTEAIAPALAGMKFKRLFANQYGKVICRCRLAGFNISVIFINHILHCFSGRKRSVRICKTCCHIEKILYNNFSFCGNISFFSKHRLIFETWNKITYRVRESDKSFFDKGHNSD